MWCDEKENGRCLRTESSKLLMSMVVFKARQEYYERERRMVVARKVKTLHAPDGGQSERVIKKVTNHGHCMNTVQYCGTPTGGKCEAVHSQKPSRPVFERQAGVPRLSLLKVIYLEMISEILVSLQIIFGHTRYHIL